VVAEVVVTPTLAARKLGADFPIFEQRMDEKAPSGVRAGLAIRDFAGRGSGEDLGLDTWMDRQPGTEAGSNLELGLRLGGSAREEDLDRVATGLAANAAPSSEEVAEVGDEGRVAESDPGLGGQARLALRRAHRVDAPELNLDRCDPARPVARSVPAAAGRRLPGTSRARP
jgi:hypothetical protein